MTPLVPCLAEIAPPSVMVEDLMEDDSSLEDISSSSGDNYIPRSIPESSDENSDIESVSHSTCVPLPGFKTLPL